MPRGRKPKYPSGLTIGQFLLFDAPHRWVGRCRDGADGQVTLTEEHVDSALDRTFGIPDWPGENPIKHVGIDVLDLPSRAVGPLAEMGVETVDQLLAVERQELLSKRRLGVVSVNRIRHELLDLLFPPHVGQFAGPVPPFEEMVRDFVNRAIDDPRRRRLALGRLAPRREKPLPLKAFGDELGVSRERIRQIVETCFDRLAKPAKLVMLNPFWDRVWDVLNEGGGAMASRELAEQLRRRLAWPAVPPAGALERLCQLHPCLIVDEGHIRRV